MSIKMNEGSLNGFQQNRQSQNVYYDSPFDTSVRVTRPTKDRTKVRPGVSIFAPFERCQGL